MSSALSAPFTFVALPRLAILIAAGFFSVSCEEEKPKLERPGETPHAVSGSKAAAPAKTSSKDDGEKPDRPRLSPALDLLPAGSTMRGVRIPRYDKDRQRSALLRAGSLIVRSENHVSGDNIALRIFFKGGEQNLRVHMGAAEFYRTTGVLEAKELLTVDGEGFEARGIGGVFQTDVRQGFVNGPVTTSFKPKPKKEEGKDDDKPAPEAAPALEPPPPVVVEVPELIEPLPLTVDELEALDALLKSQTDIVLADRAPTRQMVTRSQQLALKADLGLDSFAKRVEHLEILARTRPGGTPPVLDNGSTGKVEGISVQADGGMYVDADGGHVAYLRNIVVREARFSLSCENKLKVFFERRTAAEDDKDKEKDKQTGGKPREDKEENEKSDGLGDLESFADVKMIEATGAVTVVREDPEGKRAPIIATAATAILDVETGDIVLRGGTPTVRQGLSFLRAEEPDLYLRLYANGNIFAERGRWITVGDLAGLKKDKKEKAGADHPADDKKPAAPKLIEVTCSGGMYFDAKSGQIVYLEDVTVKDPRFSMSCANELKIVLARKESKDKEKSAGPDSFGDVQAIVASGKVEVVRTDPAGKREPVVATGEAVSYDARSGEVFLRGGSPTIQQGGNSLRAETPDLYLRFYQNGSFFAEPGRWTTVGDLANLRKKPGDKPKPKKLIQVTSDRGLFFDAVKGQVVYRGNIKAIEPRFRMNCARELVVHLAKKADADARELEGPDAFGDVKAIVAQGSVVVIRKDPRGKKDPVVASADTATYDAKSGDVVLRGGYPSLRQGASSLRATEPGLYLRFYADGRFHTNRGKWLTDPDLKDLRKK